MQIAGPEKKIIISLRGEKGTALILQPNILVYEESIKYLRK